jgi:predicted ATPase/DNA-binding CsgD family transcriptional regulator
LGNLPAELTRFVGRRSEVLEVRRTLARTRLLTLTGPGGVGKTRLALTVASQLRRTFADGAWLVDLAPLREPELLAVTVANGLGVRDESSSRPVVDLLQDYLADRSLLVVLDNCEHLLDGCAEMVATLLRASPGLRIVATSREPLRVDGEQVFGVPPLSLPEDDDGAVREVMASEAVALFVERAMAAVPGFAVHAADTPTVARIVRVLDGVPLAIELAAVQMRALSLQQLLDRMGDALGLLAGGMRTPLPRQRTLRAMIDWSFDLCTPEERMLWARLSVFAASFDMAAACEVCSGDGLSDDVLELVARLVDKSILQREEHSSGPRYRLLDTLRQYGLERLAASGAQATLRRRHRDRYRRLTARVDDEWYGPRQLEWFTRMRLEHADVRAALDFCVSEPGAAASGLEIASALRVYWHASASLTEGRHWLGLLLDRHPENDPLRAKALRTAGLLALYHNDVREATALARDARERALRLDDPALVAWAALGLGFATMFGDDVPAAVPLLEEALAGLRAVRDGGGTLLALLVLGTAVALRGDPDRAVVLGQEGVMFSESLGESWMRAWLMWLLGIVAWQQGDIRRAADFEREGIRLKRAFDDGAGIGQCAEVLAWVAAGEGRPERAARLLGAVQGIWRRTGSSLYRHLVPFHERVRDELCRSLGEDGFEAAFQDGMRFDLDQTVGYAFEQRAKSRTPASGVTETLTRRESEIAELIAKGLTNRECAEQLVISQRTVETHVEHILTKLGFSSRAQVASWVAGEHSAPPR